jgi:hypothetical protein
METYHQHLRQVAILMGLPHTGSINELKWRIHDAREQYRREHIRTIARQRCVPEHCLRGDTSDIIDIIHDYCTK